MSLAPAGVNDQDGRGEKFVSLAQSADYYGMSERSIRRMIAEGKLPAYRVGKRQIRIKVTDLEALAAPIPAASV